MASTFRGVNSFPLVLLPRGLERRTRSKRPSFWLQNKQKWTIFLLECRLLQFPVPLHKDSHILREWDGRALNAKSDVGAWMGREGLVLILAQQFTSYDTLRTFLNFFGLQFPLTLKRSLNEIQDVKCLARSSSMQQSFIPSRTHLFGISNFLCTSPWCPDSDLHPEKAWSNVPWAELNDINYTKQISYPGVHRHLPLTYRI